MSLESETFDACTEQLERIGFKSKRSGIYLQPISSDVMGWLGLNTLSAQLPDRFGVNPVIGVCHVKLERALLEVAKGKRRSPIPSLSRPLGYLMPEHRFRTWFFTHGEPLEPVASDLASAVSVYGQRFIDTYADWDAYSNNIKDLDLILEPERQIYFPLIDALNGHVPEAREVVRAELARIAESEDLYAAAYREFAEAFLTRYRS